MSDSTRQEVRAYNNGTVAVTVAPAVTQSHAYCFGTECRLLPCASIANRGGIQAH